jgi:hypothetical protein
MTFPSSFAVHYVFAKQWVAFYRQSGEWQIVSESNLARPNTPGSLAGEFYKYFKRINSRC